MNCQAQGIIRCIRGRNEGSNLILTKEKMKKKKIDKRFEKLERFKELDLENKLLEIYIILEILWKLNEWKISKKN